MPTPVSETVIAPTVPSAVAPPVESVSAGNAGTTARMAFSLATISLTASLTVPSAVSKPAFWAQSVVPSTAGVRSPIGLIVPLAEPPAELVSAVTAAVSSFTAA